MDIANETKHKSLVVYFFSVQIFSKRSKADLSVKVKQE